MASDANESTNTASGDNVPPPAPFSSKGGTECCHNTSNNTKNLVICIDSEWNRHAVTNTSIVEIYNLVSNIDGSMQLTWYDTGSGPYTISWNSMKGFKSVLQMIAQDLDTAISWRFEQTVQAAYHWLCDHYEAGDRIFCFGFARGALQVRVLSAMIAKVGLISKGNEMQIPFAYEIYRDLSSGGVDLAEHFKKTFSRKDVKVHFIGAWDTTSHLGIVGVDGITFPGVAEGMEHVCYFRHALALDECRVMFLPLYANRLSAQDGRDHDIRKTVRRQTSNSLISRPQTIEVWFSGTHGDIGGLNTKGNRPALRWMIHEAGGFGLRTKLVAHRLHYDEDVKVVKSLRGTWWIFELLPWRRWTYTSKLGGKRSTHKPHLGRSRTIEHGQKLHFSVLRALSKGGYIPRALLTLHSIGNDLQSAASIDNWVVTDADELLKALINKFVLDKDHTLWDAVTRFSISDVGRQTVYEEVMLYITAEDDQHTVDDKSRSQLIRKTRALLKDHRTQLRMRDEIKAKQSALHDGPIRMYEKEERRFLDEFTTYQRLVLKGDRSPVCSIAISEDGTRIVSGSQNGTLFQWNTSTGENITENSIAHESALINCIAFSRNGAYIASASTDQTFTIWNNTSAPPQILYVHHHFISTMTFSPDGKRLVSGSDRTLRIWDIDGGDTIAWQCMEGEGHTGAVLSLSFSPNGTRIASGSTDKTLRIWDADARTQLGLPLEGHKDYVHSIAFSPDGNTVVSGSADCTIRIWDVATGCQVGQSLVGHESTVYSVSFSPDGRRIASGSADRTVRIWDVATGKQIGEPLKGHRRDVSSVCFFPDGFRVVSGSDDWTLRVWDVTLK